MLAHIGYDWNMSATKVIQILNITIYVLVKNPIVSFQ
jgi:hypothetical protein